MKILRYLKFSNCKKEIEGYGYHYSFQQYLKQLLICIAVIIFVGYMLYMNAVAMLAVCVAVAFALPYFVMQHFRFLYEAERFEDVTSYMESMMNAFKRTPKVLTALQETATVTKGAIKNLVEQAIEKIKVYDTYENIYRGAFALISEEYHCTRLDVMHDFMVRIEMQGGDYKNSMRVLQEDLFNWNEITYSIQKERKHHFNILLGACAMTIVVIVLMVRNINTMRDMVDMATSPLYQVSCSIFLIAVIVLCCMAYKKIVCSWIKEEFAMSKEEIDKYFNTIHTYDAASGQKKDLIKCAIFFILALVCVVMKIMPGIIGSVVLIIFFYGASERHVRFAKKKLSKEIEKAFPMWLRSVALAMQTENVHMALTKTLKQAPYVLQSELEKVLDNIEKRPESLKSYMTFLEDFDLKEIRSVFMMFYSMNAFGSEGEQSTEQLDEMISRNNKLAIKAEKLANEDSLASFNLYAMMPMLLGAGKLLCDLWVFVQMFMAAASFKGF